MPFTCPEFPGRVFESLKELQTLRDEKQRLKRRLVSKATTALAVKPTKKEESDGEAGTRSGGAANLENC